MASMADWAAVLLSLVKAEWWNRTANSSSTWDCSFVEAQVAEAEAAWPVLTRCLRYVSECYCYEPGRRSLVIVHPPTAAARGGREKEHVEAIVEEGDGR